MAKYLSKVGEIEAVQLTEDVNEQVKKGDWLVDLPTGHKVYWANAAFSQECKQKFPKAANEEVEIFSNQGFPTIE